MSAEWERRECGGGGRGEEARGVARALHRLAQIALVLLAVLDESAPAVAGAVGVRAELLVSVPALPLAVNAAAAAERALALKLGRHRRLAALVAVQPYLLAAELAVSVHETAHAFITQYTVQLVADYMKYINCSIPAAVADAAGVAAVALLPFSGLHDAVHQTLPAVVALPLRARRSRRPASRAQ